MEYSDIWRLNNLSKENRAEEEKCQVSGTVLTNGIQPQAKRKAIEQDEWKNRVDNICFMAISA